MDKHYYLLINKVNYKFNSTIDVITFNKKVEATVYRNKLLKNVSRKVELDETNYGIGNPDILLIVNDNELVYTISRVLLKNARLTDKLKVIYKLNAREFSQSCTKSNLGKINAFLGSIPNKKTQVKNTKSREPEYIVLYDENWNPIGCMKSWNT